MWTVGALQREWASASALADRIEPRLTRDVEIVRGLQIGLHGSLRQENLEAEPFAQALPDLGQAGQFLQRGHCILGAVDLVHAPGLLGVEPRGGKQAGSVQVQKRREMLGAEHIDRPGIALRDVFVVEDLAHHTPFLVSARTLSLLCLGRDFVNSTCSLSNNAATRALMYSLPLSL